MHVPYISAINSGTKMFPDI